MTEDSGNGPAVPVDDQSQKHKKETDRHEITHLPVQEMKILMAESDDEFPTGLHGSCQNNKQYAKTYSPVIRLCYSVSFKWILHY